MPRDACTNRHHSLSRPPPIRRDRPLKNHGCMSCVEAPRGRECPYREAYGCDDTTREAGLELGHCVIERIWREQAREKTRAALEGLPSWMQSRADEIVELLLDAHLYVLRATAWAGIAFNRDPAAGGYDVLDPEFARAAFRYRVEGGSALTARYAQLRPYLDAAREMRESGWIEKLRRLATKTA